MKIFFLIGIVGCVCLAVPVQAQLQKGTKYLGATVSFGGSQGRVEGGPGTTSIQNSFSANPSLQAGVFIKDKTMLGIGFGSALNFLWTKSKPAQSLPVYKTTYQVYSLTPFIRHYKSLSGKWAIFLNSSAQVSLLTNKIFTDNITVKEDGYSVGLQVTPGISYWITPRFALETDINLLSLGAGYQDLFNTKTLYFNSAVTSNLSSYFSVRASWYLHKP